MLSAQFSWCFSPIGRVLRTGIMHDLDNHIQIYTYNALVYTSLYTAVECKERYKHKHPGRPELINILYKNDFPVGNFNLVDRRFNLIFTIIVSDAKRSVGVSVYVDSARNIIFNNKKKKNLDQLTMA